MSMNPISQHHPQFCSWAPPLGNPHLYRHHTYRVSQEGDQYEREHMFEKSLTPSDVGKLNRLVIPKHHAEKYLPLDGEAGERGLLLSFEDESGKPWRFRYSYWSSSQSYVLTKGWSRFVKEKGLDAGDLVSFGRLRGGGDRLCISCRRRGENERPPAACTATTGDAAVPWSPTCYTARAHAPTSHTGDQDLAMAPTHSKRLRLFGVNLDCAPAPEPETKLVLAPETEPTRSGHQCLYKHITIQADLDGGEERGRC